MLVFFFFNDTATTEIYTLSLHDALPICAQGEIARVLARGGDKIIGLVLAGDGFAAQGLHGEALERYRRADRKSTRLNSSHLVISYAVFCLKKKKNSEETVLLSIADRLIR